MAMPRVVSLLCLLFVLNSYASECRRVTSALSQSRGVSADDSTVLLQVKLMPVRTVEAPAQPVSHGLATVIAPPPLKQDASVHPGVLSNPVAAGLMLGLMLIGPDHLATLMALSTLTDGFASFKVGFWWGLGHSCGMILLCPLFYFLKEFTSKNTSISLEKWEYWGDYFIGASMVIVAIYFIVYQSRYVEQRSDGSFATKCCSCHGDPLEDKANAEPDAHISEPGPRFCSSYRQGKSASPERRPRLQLQRSRSPPESRPHLQLQRGRSPPQDRTASTSSQMGNTEAYRHGTSETATAIESDKDNDIEVAPPPVPDFVKDAESSARSFVSMSDLHRAALGVLQGLCCPMGLAGIGFVGRVSITTSPLMLFAFASVFLTASACGSAAITYGWGMLTTRGTASMLSPRTMYMGSCFATLLLGIMWIAANAAGVLDNLNYADNLNARIAHMSDHPH